MRKNNQIQNKGEIIMDNLTASGEVKFLRNLIKEYKHWAIYIYHNQGYLGRCVVWCKREDALDLTDATIEEQQELFLVLHDLTKAMEKIFQPDWFNYSFLGNQTRHLHGHFIPRYKNQKMFMGVKFEDKLYGHNYKTDHSFVTPESLLDVVKNKIIEMLK
ncbi:HIT family protein [Patescibacteria group bacterium]|nr:HIT family protein [Patescibacteria group bacterium]